MSVFIALGGCQAKVFGSFYEYTGCDGANTGPKQRIGDTSCMNPDTTVPTTSIWISKITKKERKICLRRFKGTGCDTANEDLPQQLIIPKTDEGKCIKLSGIHKSFQYGEDDQCSGDYFVAEDFVTR